MELDVPSIGKVDANKTERDSKISEILAWSTGNKYFLDSVRDIINAYTIDKSAQSTIVQNNEPHGNQLNRLLYLHENELQKTKKYKKHYTSLIKIIDYLNEGGDIGLIHARLSVTKDTKNKTNSLRDELETRRIHIKEIDTETKETLKREKELEKQLLSLKKQYYAINNPPKKVIAGLNKDLDALKGSLEFIINHRNENTGALTPYLNGIAKKMGIESGEDIYESIFDRAKEKMIDLYRQLDDFKKRGDLSLEDQYQINLINSGLSRIREIKLGGAPLFGSIWNTIKYLPEVGINAIKGK